MLRIALALALCLAVSACSADSVDLTLTDPVLLDGVYTSTGSVGDLGQLQLTLRKRSKAVRTYNGELSGNQLEVQTSPGAGTLGNDHFIMDFDIGSVDDFYFQGKVQQDAAGKVTGLTGTFIFPSQPEQLPVEFTWISDPPPVEEGSS